MNDKARREKTNEILSQPRDYLDQKENYITHLAFIISEISKEI